jgi:hypothetical protein
MQNASNLEFDIHKSLNNNGNVWLISKHGDVIVILITLCGLSVTFIFYCHTLVENNKDDSCSNLSRVHSNHLNLGMNII